MEIRRYSIECGRLIESSEGGWCHRADLIAAGVLVTVLEGDNPGCMRLVRLEDVG